MTSQRITGTHDSAPSLTGRQSGGSSPAARPRRSQAERQDLGSSPFPSPLRLIYGRDTLDRRASIMPLYYGY